MTALPVSVIIPAKNAARFLQGALDSVSALTVRPAEILVIDDGSTDATAEIARAHPGVRVIATEGQGAAAGFNTGVRHAAAPLLAFLSADDRWEPAKLERQLPLLGDGPGVLTLFRYFLYPGCTIPTAMNPALFERDLVGQIPETLLVRRDFQIEIGEYPERLRTGFDVEWFARVAERGIRFPVVSEVLLRKGVHEANLTNSSRETAPVLLDLLRASLRRRKEGGDGR